MAALTRDEEVALARRREAGDKQAESQLVEAHLPWVRAVAGKFRGRGVDLADLVQLGWIGLLKAVRKFRPDVGVRLTTYAYPFILRPISKAVRKASRSRLEFVPPERLLAVEDGDDPIDYGLRNRALQVACDQLLNPDERLVLMMRFSDSKELSYRQIGALTGRSKPAVGRTHRKAIAKLRRQLNPTAA